MAGKCVGVLALQGDFDAHRAALHALNIRSQEVRRETDLEGISGLILPGGESTALLRLAEKTLISAILNRVVDGLPILATCAGLILLAKEVQNPTQHSLGVLDVCVERNAYGRQADSFIDPELQWTKEGRQLLQQQIPDYTPSPLEGVFIRAPRIRSVGSNVEVLLTRHAEPVLVRQEAIFAGSFHPELSKGKNPIHELFLSFVNESDTE